MNSNRIAAQAWCLAQQGKPYIWNGDGPDGYDCNGIACGCIVAGGGPDLRATHNCDRLFRELEPTDLPLAMDFALYGSPGHATHVMVVWGDGRVFGACGGNEYVTTPAIAFSKGACVRFRSSHLYLPTFLGFRVNPLPKENP